MAVHASLRTDCLNSEGIRDLTMDVLVPGPNFPDDPTDFTTETITYIDPESLREYTQNLDTLQKASTLGFAKESGDAIYQNVVRQLVTGSDVLYATNPDDPENPTVITVGAGAATVIWKEEGSTIVTAGTVNFVGAAVTVTDVGGVATVTITGNTYTGGDGIAIDGSNDIDVDLAATSGLTFSAGKLLVDQGAGIYFDGNCVAVEIETNKGLEFDAVGAAGKLRVKEGDGIEFVSGAVAVDLYSVSGLEFVGSTPAGELRVAQGAGIWLDTGNSNTVAVELDTDPGLEFSTTGTAGKLRAKAGTYIDVDSNGISVDLTEVSGYSGGTTQLLGHVSGTFQFKTVAEWLNTLAGYVSGNNQSIGHDASGATVWQDDGAC